MPCLGASSVRCVRVGSGLRAGVIPRCTALYAYCTLSNAPTSRSVFASARARTTPLQGKSRMKALLGIALAVACLLPTAPGVDATQTKPARGTADLVARDHEF